MGNKERFIFHNKQETLTHIETLRCQIGRPCVISLDINKWSYPLNGFTENKTAKLLHDSPFEVVYNYMDMEIHFY